MHSETNKLNVILMIYITGIVQSVCLQLHMLLVLLVLQY